MNKIKNVAKEVKDNKKGVMLFAGLAVIGGLSAFAGIRIGNKIFK